MKGFGGQSEELDLSLEEKLLEQIKTGKVATKKHRSRAIAKPRETSAAPEKGMLEKFACEWGVGWGDWV